MVSWCPGIRMQQLFTWAGLLLKHWSSCLTQPHFFLSKLLSLLPYDCPLPLHTQWSMVRLFLSCFHQETPYPICIIYFSFPACSALRWGQPSISSFLLKLKTLQPVNRLVNAADRQLAVKAHQDYMTLSVYILSYFTQCFLTGSRTISWRSPSPEKALCRELSYIS